MAELSRKEKAEAAQQLRQKLILEAELFRRLQKFFNKQNHYMFSRLESTGNIADAAELNPELTRILEEHYKKASEWYARRTIDKINVAVGASDGTGLTVKNPVIDAVILSMIRQGVDGDVSYLADNSNSEALAALENTDTIESARIRMDARAVSRADRHATNINQRAIEGTKHTVATSAQRALRFGTGLSFFLSQSKVWSATIDNATRDWHVAANGQTVPIDEPFIVSGEELMYPGDFSLGATAKNIERCRCISINKTIAA